MILKSKHYFIGLCLLTILVGLLYILPPLFVWRYINNFDEPFILAQLETYKDEIKDYLPRAREVYDGHFSPKDAYFEEQRPTVLNPLPSLLFSLFIFLFKGDINLAYLGAQFFLSGLIFLLFYFLGRCLFESKLWQIFFALVGVLTPLSFLFYRWSDDIWGSLNEIVSITIKQFIPLVRTQTHKLYLARIDDPLLTYPFFLTAIVFFFKFWLKPARRFAILAGMSAGLLFYVYFHYWVLWATIILIMFLYSLYSRRENPEKFKNYLLLLGVWVIFSIPYLINYFRVTNFLDYNDFVYRFGMAVGRNWDVVWQLRWRYPVYFLSAVLVYLAYFRYKKEKEKAVLFLGCCLAMFISPHLQLLTGFMPVPGQATKAAALLLFIILFTICYDGVKLIEEKRSSFKKVFLMLLVLFLVTLPFKKIVNILDISQPASEIIKSYHFPGEIVDSWKWINIDWPPESSVISSSVVTSVYLSTYTSARPFLAVGFASAMPMKLLENRFLLANKFFNVDPEVVKKRLVQEEVSCFSDCPKDGWMNLNKSFRFIYINYFASGQKVLSGDAFMPRDYLDVLVENYQEIMVKDYKYLGVGYVYYGPLEKQFSQPKFTQDQNLTLVFMNPSVTIYKVN